MKYNGFKRLLAGLLTVLLTVSMLTVALPAVAVETDPYAKVTGTADGDVITPDGNVTFIFTAKPADASADGFSYPYPGNGKTYFLKWGVNATTFTQSNLVNKINTLAKAWAQDTTGTVSRDVVFVFAPGTYSTAINLSGATTYTRATGSDPTVDEVVNVYLLGAKAGVNPVSADRSTKEKATAVQKGRSVSDDTETVITALWRFPQRCNFTIDGFSATTNGTFFTQSASVCCNAYIKNHYVTNLTGGGMSSAIMYNRADSRHLYEYENCYFDMQLDGPLATGFAGFYTNKLVFNNCVFANADTEIKSQRMIWYPFASTDAATYKNFFGTYAINPTYKVINSVFADWKDSQIIGFALGSRTYGYGKHATKVTFDGNTVFDCGQVAEDSKVFFIGATADGDRAHDFVISLQNNTFSFSDTLFGQGTTGNSYAIDLGKFTEAAVEGKITFKGNTFTVPADGKTQVFTGVHYDCAAWDKGNNVLKTNAGDTLEIDYPVYGHVEGEMVLDVPPTATEEGVGHTTCTRCGDKFSYVIAPGEAQIGSTIYTTFTQALAAAKAGDAILLRGNVQSSSVAIAPGVTLDLQGWKLTAEHVVGFKNSAIIDSSEGSTGKLIVSSDEMVLDQSNQGYIPVYDTNGYIFTTVGMIGRSAFSAVDHFVFSPMFEKHAHPALLGGVEKSGVEVIIRLSWGYEGEYECVQDYTYFDDSVRSFINSYNTDKADYDNLFYAKFGGRDVKNDADVKVDAVIKSAAGTEITASSTDFDEDNIVLSFGAISDTHVRTPNASVAEAEKFERALEQLKKQALVDDEDGLDAVAIAGDLTDMGRTVQADVLIDIVKKAGIENLMLSLGNHDMYSIGSSTYSPALLPYYAEQLGDIFTKNATDMSLIEKGAYHCVVKGQHFIMIQPAEADLKENQNYFPYDEEVLEWLDTTLAEITAADPTSYVFLFNHVALLNTTYDTHLNWQNYVTKYLGSTINKYPQVMLFTGHLHRSLVDERCIMQTEVTHVHAGGTNSNGSTYRTSGVVIPDSSTDYATGHLVQVDIHGNVRLTRLSFTYDSEIKDPLVLAHPTADKAHLNRYTRERREAKNVAPTLSGTLTASATTATAETGFTATISLAFDAGADDDFVHNYRVTVTNLATGVATVKNFCSGFYMFDDPAKMPTDIEFSFDLACTADGEYSVAVTAMDSWEAESEPITCNVTLAAPAA